MRITAQARKATRARILVSARRLFREKGFEGAAIRDIAREAGVAAGTLFNYFSSKEEIAAALAHEAAAKARTDFGKKRRPDATLREDLFLQITTQLRRLKPLRKFIQTVIDAGLPSPAGAGERLRREQRDTVAEIFHDHGVDADRNPVAAPLYWALYIGVLSFWGRDRSPKQEDTLAMLDQAVNMFVAWLEAEAPHRPPT